ncbi:hypothetical protein [Paenibacillus sp. CMAA1364]
MPPTYTSNKELQLPTPRSIRRACSKELYRTIKRMKVHIPDPLLQQGEDMYYRKVIGNLIWIHENHSNRKILYQWWEREVSQELALLWQVDHRKLCVAFRDAFGG